MSKQTIPPDERGLKLLADTALVKQVQRNLQGQTAFAELYRRHVTRVYRFLLARVGNEQDAQDLTAQTFLNALEAIPSYQGRSTFSTWLLGIARHRAGDHFRKQKEVVPLDNLPEDQHAADFPEEAVEHQLKLEAVLSKMHLLTTDRAEALALHSFAGLPIAQVAQVMEKREAAVRMLIHRAIRDLQRWLRVQPEQEAVR